jgi:hypothetical protein
VFDAVEQFRQPDGTYRQDNPFQLRDRPQAGLTAMQRPMFKAGSARTS